MKTYDVSLLLKPGMPVWPGEPGFEISRIKSIEGGMGANVSAIRTGCHIGTHIDAPLHFIEGGKSVDQLPLDLFVGRVTVYFLPFQRWIDRETIVPLGIRKGQRVIFRTSNSSLWGQDGGFRKEYVHITEDAARYLADIGVKTVGIDYLSIEAFGLDACPAHHILLGAGVGIIEGLDLREISEGEYDLCCLPLKIDGADGSPARVILREIV